MEVAANKALFTDITNFENYALFQILQLDWHLHGLGVVIWLSENKLSLQSFQGMAVFTGSGNWFNKLPIWPNEPFQPGQVTEVTAGWEEQEMFPWL